MTESPKRLNPSPSSIAMDDPRYPIWGRLFLCRVPRISFYSTGYLEQFGLHSSGNRGVDLELAKQPQLVYITINNMIELYEQSQLVSIVKQTDFKTIYEICQDYTFNAADKLSHARAVFQHNIPFVDLVKIDEFAEAVYQFAGHEYGNEFARTFLPKNLTEEVASLNSLFEAVDKRVKARHKRKDNKATIYDILSNANPQVLQEEVKSDADREPLPPRPSVRDLFLSYMGENGGDRL